MNIKYIAIVFLLCYFRDLDSGESNSFHSQNSDYTSPKHILNSDRKSSIGKMADIKDRLYHDVLLLNWKRMLLNQDGLRFEFFNCGLFYDPTTCNYR